MFKNLTVYRLNPDWSADLAAAEEALAKARFTPCSPSQPLSVGWVAPRGRPHDPLVESVGGQWLVKLMVEQKVLPASVIKRRVEEMSAQIEQQTGRKPGRKQAKELKEQATHELLPMAFTKQAAVAVWIDPKGRLLVIDSGSAKRAEDVVTQLVKAIDGFGVLAVNTNLSPASAMAGWLGSGEAPSGFSIDRECELKSVDEMKSTVKYARHGLDTDEVRQHILLGKQPTRLAMTWDGRISFVLTDTLQIKKVDFQDVVFEGQQRSRNAEENFDADLSISTGELVQMLPDLLDALGGEAPLPGQADAATVKAQAEAAIAAHEAAGETAPF